MAGDNDIPQGDESFKAVVGEVVKAEIRGVFAEWVKTDLVPRLDAIEAKIPKVDANLIAGEAAKAVIAHFEAKAQAAQAQSRDQLAAAASQAAQPAAGAPSALASLNPLMNGLIEGAAKIFDLWVKYKETTKVGAPDAHPLVWAFNLSKTDPQAAAWVGSMLAPHNPIEDRIPQLAADIGVKTYGAALQAFRAENRLRQPERKAPAALPDPLDSEPEDYAPPSDESPEANDPETIVSVAQRPQPRRSARPVIEHSNGATPKANGRAPVTFGSLARGE